jgi:phospholipid N-methyltransferase
MPLEKLRPQPDERLAFLQGFLRKPQQVGSVIPSSRFLERRIVALADLRHAKLAVELGPGTGGTTRALLAALPPDARLLCVEIDADFAELLRKRPDPRLIVHHGSAENLPEILAQHGLAAPDAVISGIPFSTIPAAIGARIIESIRSALAPGGRFVAYQVRGVVADLARPILGKPDFAIELLNIPPVRVYRWHADRARASRAVGRSAAPESLRA